jgi:hypothetical protein
MAKLAKDPETLAMTAVIVAVGKLEIAVKEALDGLPPETEARVRAWIASRYPSLPVPQAKEQAS